jgi:tetratricopeptide (TPR) repeat protein
MLRKKAFSLLLALFRFLVWDVSAQDQKIADSLAFVYQQNTLEDTAKLEVLRNLSFNETRNLTKGLAYAEDLITLSEQTGRKDYLRKAYFLKGTKHRLLGNPEQALDAYIKSAEVARQTGHLRAEGEAFSAIADSYTVVDNLATARFYYNQAILALRKSKPRTQEDSINLASVLLNAGKLSESQKL